MSNDAEFNAELIYWNYHWPIDKQGEMPFEEWLKDTRLRNGEELTEEQKDALRRVHAREAPQDGNSSTRQAKPYF